MKIKIFIVCITLYVVVVTGTFSSAYNGNISYQVFNPPIQYATGKGSDGVEIGDINSDSKNELVVANRLTENLTLFKQTGNSQNPLEEYQTCPIAWSPAVVAIADINQDSFNDVAIAHYTEYYSGGKGLTNTFGVCYQNPTTHLLDTEKGYSISGQSCRGIAAGDINSDSKAEVIVANEGSGSKIFVWEWNTTSNTLEQIASYTGASGYVISISIGDVNGDSKNDVVLYGSSLIVFIQDSTGKLLSPVNYGSTGSDGQPGGESGGIGDINGDGLNDVAGSTAHSGKMIVWLQDATSHTLAKDSYSPYDCGGYTEDCHVDDMNDDSFDDILVASRDKSEAYIFYQNTTTHLLDSPVIYATIPTRWINELAVGDLNNDGSTDFAGSNWGYMGVDDPNPEYTYVSVWLQKIAVTPEFSIPLIFIVSTSSLIIAIAVWRKHQ